MLGGLMYFGRKISHSATERASVRLPLPGMEMGGSADMLRAMDPLNAEWVTLILLFSFALLAMINVNSPRKWRLLTQAIFSMRLGRQALREEIDLRDRTLLGLVSIAVAVLALFIWQGAMLVAAAAAPPFHHVMLLVFAVVLGQALLVWFLGALVKADGGMQEHLYTGLLLFILAGIILLPLVVLIAYRAEWRLPLLIAGAVLLVLSLIYRWVRAFWIGSGEGVPSRYIIIYLCGAEILPLLLLIHALRPSIPSLFNL